MLNKKALAASLSATAAKVYVEDVFSTWLYTGNGSSNPGQTITNGINLLNEGGMVWIKNRGGGYGHRLFDSARGSNYLDTSSTVASSPGLNFTRTTSGFTLKDTDFEVNATNEIYTSWTFREQTKFFDVVTYTGNGSNRTISHNLGSVPGSIFIKRTDTTGAWAVYHRSLANTEYMVLNTTAAKATGTTYWNSTTPTSTEFSLGTATDVNANNGTYVAYLFAHDAGGFGANGTDNVISCGSYTGNGSATGPTIDLGWEPQWVLIKRASGVENWYLMDNMRGFIANGDIQRLYPNDSLAEDTGTILVAPTATGFKILTSDVSFNTSGNTYVYIAIRRGPMKTPTDATKVFTPTVYTGTNVDNRLINTTIAPDFVMIRQRNDAVVPGMYTGARLTGQEYMLTGSNVAGATDADSFDAQIVSAVEYGNAFSSMSGVWVGNDATRKFNANTTSNNHIIHAFKRAAGFFDVVCYTGTGANTTISHNLGVAPEMMIIKKRSATGSPSVYHASVGNTKYMELNSTAVPATSSTYWNNTTPTSSVFSLGTNTEVNANGSTYIAFLFASCSGVSKVGTFTGSGNVDCGFANGARYILIKKTSGTPEDSTWSWHVFDTARGIVAASDPVLWLNENTAESTTGDYVDPLNAGFSTTAYWSGDFVYLAIA